MAAICGMRQVADGIRAMQDAAYPGKIVVYPSVLDFPLTGLPELRDVLPQVYQALEDGCVWTNAAEEQFLECMLRRSRGRGKSFGGTSPPVGHCSDQDRVVLAVFGRLANDQFRVQYDFFVTGLGIFYLANE